jgi:hypothetical protein
MTAHIGVITAVTLEFPFVCLKYRSGSLLGIAKYLIHIVLQATLEVSPSIMSLTSCQKPQ